MNEVFLIGKIVSRINFDFIIKSKKHAISKFKIETFDGTLLNIRAYDKLADYVYAKLKKDDSIFIYGSLNNNFVFGKSVYKL